MILAEQARLEDGEEGEPSPGRQFPSYGLHAKAYIADLGAWSHQDSRSATPWDRERWTYVTQKASFRSWLISFTQ